MSTLVRTKSFFDTYAKDFDAIYGGSHKGINRVVNSLFRRSMLERYKRTLSECSEIEGKHVLDVGCGPGHYCVALAQAGAASCVGIDFARGMLVLAEARSRDSSVEGRCKFIEADVMELSESRSFDYVIAMGFMDYVAEPAPLIAKLARLAQRKVLMSFPIAGGILAWQRKIRYRSKCDLYLYTPEQLKRMLAEVSGFHIQIDRIARDYFVVLSRIQPGS